MKSEGKVTGWRCHGCLFSFPVTREPGGYTPKGKPQCGACYGRYLRHLKRSEGVRLAAAKEAGIRYSKGAQIKIADNNSNNPNNND